MSFFGFVFWDSICVFLGWWCYLEVFEQFQLRLDKVCILLLIRSELFHEKQIACAVNNGFVCFGSLFKVIEIFKTSELEIDVVGTLIGGLFRFGIIYQYFFINGFFDSVVDHIFTCFDLVSFNSFVSVLFHLLFYLNQSF